MARAGDRVLKIARTLAALICVLTIENIWIDPWVQRRAHHRLPSFAPEALGGVWFLILVALAVSVIFLVVCQILLMRDSTVSKPKKISTGILALAAAILTGDWFIATSGTTFAKPATRGEAAAASEPQKRSVVLRWQASTTPNVKYNVYRGPSWGIYPDKLNSAPIDGTTFTDPTAVSGQKYWYVVRAVNAKGEESHDSNETSATIP